MKLCHCFQPEEKREKRIPFLLISRPEINLYVQVGDGTVSLPPSNPDFTLSDWKLLTEAKNGSLPLGHLATEVKPHRPVALGMTACTLPGTS